MEVEQFILDFSAYSNPKTDRFENLSWQKKIINFLDEWSNSDDFLTVQTSGSTGTPKQIQLPKEHAIQSAKATGTFLNLKKGNTALLCLPIHYIAGKMMLIRASVLQLKLICIEPKSTISLKNQKIHFGAMTLAQVACSKKSIESVVKLIIGGASIPVSIERSLSWYSNEIYETFGMTETISHFAIRNLTKRESFFTTLPGVCIKTDEEHRLSVKMPWNNQWMKTNDLIKQLNNHQFIWQGRLDNVINSGGVKLFPEEIEKKLESIVEENFIIASTPDQILGESLIVIVEDSPSRKKKNQLQKSIAQSHTLAKYEKPKEIYFMSEFVRTQSGKVNRKETTKAVFR